MRDRRGRVGGARSAPTLAMARLYVAPARLGAPRLILAGEEYRSLCRVLRLQPGDSLVLFDGVGQEYDATLQRVRPGSVELAVGEPRPAPSAAGVPLRLVLGLPKGAKVDLIVEKATELGVAAIILAL